MVEITYQPSKLAAPDHRSRDVHKAIVASPDVESIPTQSDPLCQEYSNMLTGTGGYSDSVAQAYFINTIPFARSTLRAFLLSSAPTPAIEAATEVSEETLHAFSRLFFDPGVFPNRLVKIAFAQQLPSDTDEERFERDMTIWGLQLGWEYLTWKVTGGRVAMPASDAIHYLMTDSLWRSREHIFSSITDAAAKESRAWIPQVLRAAELMDKIGRQGDVNPLENLKIHLIGNDETLSIEDFSSGQELLS